MQTCDPAVGIKALSTGNRIAISMGDLTIGTAWAICLQVQWQPLGE